MEPPNLRTQDAMHGAKCANCTWMRVVDSTYTCSKYDDRPVFGGNLCDDYDSIYEKEGRELLERYSPKIRSRVPLESPRLEDWSA